MSSIELEGDIHIQGRASDAEFAFSNDDDIMFELACITVSYGILMNETPTSQFSVFAVSFTVDLHNNVLFCLNLRWSVS